MTPDQLEREILDIIRKADKYSYLLPSEEDDFVKEAVELFRRELREVAEKAWDGGMAFSYDQTMSNGKKAPNYTEWLKENNLLNDNDQG